jgi:hypothetical protein
MPVAWGKYSNFIQFCGGDVQEIFAVEILPGISYPDVINHDPTIIGRSYVLPDDALSLVPAELRSPDDR